MSVDTKGKADRGTGSEIEIWVALCKAVSLLVNGLPEDDQADLLELLHEMGRSEEEMENGVETLREILRPKSGLAIPMILPGMDRSANLQKWSEYSGGRVRDFRKQAGLTQEQLAVKAGLPQSHISRIENGEVSPTRLTLEKIAVALGIPVREFDPTM